MGRPRVVVADDHLAVVEKLTHLLSSSYEVVGAVSNGQDLVSETVRLAPDVVVLDVTMPVMDGIEAAHHLRELGNSARLVFLTIHDEEELIEACFREGAQGYVLKAHMKTHLVPAIEAALLGCTFLSSAYATRSMGERHHS